VKSETFHQRQPQKAARELFEPPTDFGRKRSNDPRHSLFFSSMADSSRTPWLIMDSRPRPPPKPRPTHIFREWRKHFRVHWICLLECSIMVFYLFLGLFHQSHVVYFTRDFDDAIQGFFLHDLGFELEDNGRYPSHLPIYFEDHFLNVSLKISDRFFFLPSEFPLTSDIFSRDLGFSLAVTPRTGDPFSLQFFQSNFSILEPFLLDRLDDFRTIALSSSYVIRMVEDTVDRSLDLDVIATLHLDPTTNVVDLDVTHHRTRHGNPIEADSLIYLPSVSLPLGITVCALACILLTVKQFFDLVQYSAARQDRVGAPLSSVLRARLDRWSIYALVTHALSIVASLLYISEGMNHTERVPIVLVIIAIACAMHCLLLIRYLQGMKHTEFIITVAWRAGLLILQFVIGCGIVLAGYVMLGCCLFGGYAESFRTISEGARALIAVIHGDSIQDMFNAVDRRPDLSPYFGVTYWLVWVFFSLTIMFNISISIFEQVVASEVAREEKVEKER
jgi:hypothetical protein